MANITRSTARPTRTTAERPNLRPDTTRTASRNTDGAADAGRPRVPPAAKAAGHESGSGRSEGGSGADRVPAGTNGLVICAKSVRYAVNGGVGEELSAADALGLRFPSPDLVASAAALFEPAQPWAHGRDGLGLESESGRFRITIGPGVSASAGPVLFVRRRHRSGQSAVTDWMWPPRRTALRGAVTCPNRLGVRSPNGPASREPRCAAPSPSSITPHWWSAAVCQRW